MIPGRQHADNTQPGTWHADPGVFYPTWLTGLVTVTMLTGFSGNAWVIYVAFWSFLLELQEENSTTVAFPPPAVEPLTG